MDRKDRKEIISAERYFIHYDIGEFSHSLCTPDKTKFTRFEVFDNKTDYNEKLKELKWRSGIYKIQRHGEFKKQDPPEWNSLNNEEKALVLVLKGEVDFYFYDGEADLDTDPELEKKYPFLEKVSGDYIHDIFSTYKSSTTHRRDNITRVNMTTGPTKLPEWIYFTDPKEIDIEN